MADIKDCIDFTNEVKLCYLATTDKDQPGVRALGFWFADETGFYFQTGDVKEFYHQLKENPKTEVCFFKSMPDKIPGMMLRITGEVEFLNDKNLKEKVLIERPFLKNFGFTSDSPGLIIFRIAHGKAHFWTMETNLKAKEIINF
jgi:pyridoxamine 5'-phosphate oxidase